ncbi:pyruvate dehydrogenase [Gymnopus androsaceus JB14]|uniref:3-methyl-2-oxobutanoate dehydrogenase (2-methylpropanoyl-transferring) n=1 Tax=Gymnopus androsaceus JB14 TaxID=1447944 RepID=A0A6A4H6A2_9AGAR|nr:pyruvate dehydrogenase [Gymnopus androsaceus JB14]
MITTFRRCSPLLRRLNSTSATANSSTSTVEPPPAGGHVPSIANSSLLKQTRNEALRTPGLTWTDTDSAAPNETRKMNVYQSIRDALSTALSSDESTIVFGEDVAFGGVFRCTLGLSEEFGRDRVFNTPLTEQGLVGFGIGYASMGMGQAIAEVQFVDYIWPAFDQLLNEAAKFRYRSGGQFNLGGLTIRTPTMAVGHGGLYHSQSPEGFFMGASGLKIVIPRSPIQAKGLLLASIRDPNPVVFMEPKDIRWRHLLIHPPPVEQKQFIPGKDLTIVTYGTTVYTCERAIAMLSDPPQGVGKHVNDALKDFNKKNFKSSSSNSTPSIELIDLRTILPYDLPSVLRSVSRTRRLMIVHEGPVTGGVGAQISSEVGRRLWLEMEAPVKVVGGWDTPGVALQYEKFYIPDEIRVLDAILETLAY